MDPRRLLPALAAVACACVVATLVVALTRPDPPGTRAARPQQPVRSVAATPTGPAAVLADWDASRAAAWAEGDVPALAALYADGSRAGLADVRLLRRYLRRGLTVEGLATQVLALDVVDRSAERWVLVVTDRVVGGRAVGGATPVALPADRASTRRVVLVREGRSGSDWVVAEVRDQARAAARTSRTSSSSKS